MFSGLLTIGMSVFSDLYGPWFTIELLREAYPELKDDVSFLICDNDPDSAFGERLRTYVKDRFTRDGSTTYRAHYCAIQPRPSTSLRNVIFDAADSEYVLCVDSHIILCKGVLPKLVRFLKTGEAGYDLFHGPLVSESESVRWTHMNPAFRGGNWGTWGCMQGVDGSQAFSFDLDQPFEIPAQGMGLFLAHRESWLRFSSMFRHFGGEECYIQEKYRRFGRHAWCLPFLKWKHCFGHPGGTKYPNTFASKMRNFLIAFRELDLPLVQPFEYVRQAWLNAAGPAKRDDVMRESESVINDALSLPVVKLPPPPTGESFLGFPVRVNDLSANDSEDYSPYERRIPVQA